MEFILVMVAIVVTAVTSFLLGVKKRHHIGEKSETENSNVKGNEAQTLKKVKQLNEVEKTDKKEAALLQAQLQQERDRVSRLEESLAQIRKERENWEEQVRKTRVEVDEETAQRSEELSRLQARVDVLEKDLVVAQQRADTPPTEDVAENQSRLLGVEDKLAEVERKLKQKTEECAEQTLALEKAFCEKEQCIVREKKQERERLELAKHKDDAEQEKKELISKSKGLEERLRDISFQVHNISAEATDANHKMEHEHNLVASLNEKIEGLRKEVVELQQENRELEGQVRSLEKAAAANNADNVEKSMQLQEVGQDGKDVQMQLEGIEREQAELLSKREEVVMREEEVRARLENLVQREKELDLQIELAEKKEIDAVARVEEAMEKKALGLREREREIESRAENLKERERMVSEKIAQLGERESREETQRRQSEVEKLREEAEVLRAEAEEMKREAEVLIESTRVRAESEIVLANEVATATSERLNVERLALKTQREEVERKGAELEKKMETIAKRERELEERQAVLEEKCAEKATEAEKESDKITEARKGLEKEREAISEARSEIQMLESGIWERERMVREVEKANAEAEKALRNEREELRRDREAVEKLQQEANCTLDEARRALHQGTAMMEEARLGRAGEDVPLKEAKSAKTSSASESNECFGPSVKDEVQRKAEVVHLQQGEEVVHLQKGEEELQRGLRAIEDFMKEVKSLNHDHGVNDETDSDSDSGIEEDEETHLGDVARNWVADLEAKLSTYRQQYREIVCAPLGGAVTVGGPSILALEEHLRMMCDRLKEREEELQELQLQQQLLQQHAPSAIDEGSILKSLPAERSEEEEAEEKNSEREEKAMETGTVMQHRGLPRKTKSMAHFSQESTMRELELQQKVDKMAGELARLKASLRDRSAENEELREALGRAQKKSGDDPLRSRSPELLEKSLVRHGKSPRRTLRNKEEKEREREKGKDKAEQIDADGRVTPKERKLKNRLSMMLRSKSAVESPPTMGSGRGEGSGSATDVEENEDRPVGPRSSGSDIVKLRKALTPRGTSRADTFDDKEREKIVKSQKKGRRRSLLVKLGVKDDISAEEGELGLDEAGAAREDGEMSSGSDAGPNPDISARGKDTLHAITPTPIEAEYEAEAREENRLRIAQELAEVEDHYVENLGRILSFIDLLQETVPGGGKAWRHLADNALPPKLCEVLAVIQLLHQQHSGFRDELTTEVNGWPSQNYENRSLRAPLRSLVTLLRGGYAAYCSNYAGGKMALKTYARENPEFRDLISKYRKKHQGKDLDDFLILPVQQVPRYRLLLGEILKRTLPVHDDYEVLQSTIATIEEALNRVNDMMTQQENSKRVIDIQDRLRGKNLPTLLSPSRKLIVDGHAVVLKRGKRKPIQYFLFNDAILLARGSGGAGNGASDEELHYKALQWISEIGSVITEGHTTKGEKELFGVKWTLVKGKKAAHHESKWSLFFEREVRCGLGLPFNEKLCFRAS